jgi:drug/metabolite transporter (DMT)-like permease
MFGPVVLLPALGALAYALNMIVARRATRVRSALTFQLGATFCAAGLLLAALGLSSLFGREATSLFDAPGWALWAVLGAGALAAVTFLLITFAFSRTEASVLAPLQYLEIVGATLVGFLVFGDFPDALTWLGTAIILASGIYVFHRERKADGGPAATEPPGR